MKKTKITFENNSIYLHIQNDVVEQFCVLSELPVGWETSGNISGVPFALRAGVNQYDFFLFTQRAIVLVVQNRRVFTASDDAWVPKFAQIPFRRCRDEFSFQLKLIRFVRFRKLPHRDVRVG